MLEGRAQHLEHLPICSKHPRGALVAQLLPSLGDDLGVGPMEGLGEGILNYPRASSINGLEVGSRDDIGVVEGPQEGNLSDLGHTSQCLF